jgi:excisionase family DNA binding protein
MHDTHVQFQGLITITEAAHELRVTRGGVRYLILAGKLRPTRIGARDFLARADVAALRASRATEPVTPSPAFETFAARVARALEGK